MSTKFLQIREVKPPSRANLSDAGIDFYVPVFTEQFKKDLLEKNEFLKISSEYKPYDKSSFSCKTFKDPFKLDKENNLNYFELKPHERILIPSGIKCKIGNEVIVNNIEYHDNRALIAFNKSGVASKTGMCVGAQVIDYQYQGEIHINLVNTSNDIVKIYENQKIIQFIELPIYASEIEIVNTEEELYNGITTNRSSGGFGSSDNK